MATGDEREGARGAIASGLCRKTRPAFPRRREIITEGFQSRRVAEFSANRRNFDAHISPTFLRAINIIKFRSPEMLEVLIPEILWSTTKLRRFTVLPKNLCITRVHYAEIYKL